jgi:hypothetical protein
MTQRVLDPPRPGETVQASRGNSEPPLKDVLAELWQNIEKLLRQELALASAELDIKGQKLKRDAVALGIGAGLMLVGAFAIVAAIILLLSLAMPAWVAALATGAVLAAIGFVLLQKRPSVTGLAPERALRNIKKDIQLFTEAPK